MILPVLPSVQSLIDGGVDLVLLVQVVEGVREVVEGVVAVAAAAALRRVH